METVTTKTATASDERMGRHFVPKLGFEWFGTMGHLFVPENYQHETYLRDVRRRHSHTLESFNMLITDERCRRVSHVLKPGDKLFVSLFCNRVRRVFDVDDGLALLESQGAVFPGAQGLALLSEQKGRRFPVGYDCISLDHVQRLPIDLEGHWRVPSSPCYGDKTRGLDLEGLGWMADRTAIVCFTSHPLWP